MSSIARRFLKWFLPGVIVIIGAVLTYALYASREEPEQQQPEEPTTLVETREVVRKKHRLDVQSSGVVKPARTAAITPQISGKIVSIHPDLVTGGIIEKGETLVRLEKDDYRIAVEQAAQALEQAEAKLAIERGRHEVAKDEWQAFEKGKAEKPGKSAALALRKPQLKSAKSRVKTARSNLQKARLNLSRTKVKAPFDAIVQQEQAEIGQVAAPQSPIATLVGTNAFWVQASIPSKFIDDISIPQMADTKGSEATIEYDLGQRTIQRTGRVKRLDGQLDPKGRMAKVLIRLEDPLGLDKKSEQTDRTDRLPMLLNSYVDVEISGRRTKKLIEVPRKAVHNGDQVYVFSSNKTLQTKTIDIAWRRPETVLVKSGLEDGDRIVTSPVANPIEGMSLRRASEAQNGEPGNNEGANE